jgi:Domain of unknown function (DUF4440)
MLKGMIFIIITAVMPLSLFADNDDSLGQKLEEKIWADMKDHNWTAVSSQIAPYFQSVHEDGARNKAQEMKLIKNLNLGDYKLSEFKVTEGDDTIIVTYLIAVQETIDDKRLSTTPAVRLSVWQKNDDDTWQWIVHANLNPIPQ